jgi:hypothetical protein
VHAARFKTGSKTIPDYAQEQRSVGQQHRYTGSGDPPFDIIFALSGFLKARLPHIDVI